MRSGVRPAWALAGAATLILASAAPVCAQTAWADPTLPSQAAPTPVTADETAQLRAALAAELAKAPSEVADFYRSRHARPLWIAAGQLRPEAQSFAEGLTSAQADEVRTAVRRAADGDAEDLARAEVALSTALAGEPPVAGDEKDAIRLAFVDPELSSAWGGGRKALEAAAAAPSLADYLAGRQSSENPLARDLERGLERYRASWGSLPDVKVPAGAAFGPGAHGPRVAALRTRLGLPENGGRYDETLTSAVRAFQAAHGLSESGQADAATIEALNAGPWRYEQLILANLERARALPPALGDRYILVNAAAGRLWLYDHGQPVKTMKVVVGKPAMPTPMMAGLLRYAVFNPYWNVPADLVRDTVAQRVLKDGLGYLESENMEVLSDYTDNAVVLDPAQVDWSAVAAGTLEVRVRQKPGPKNMMGVVKLAFPNPLGIYLHDTPLKDLFGLGQRTASSGCVRLEDARTLAGLLVGDETVETATASGETEKQMALPQPVPVYVTYLTAEPEGDGFVFRPDVYGRDKAWMAQETAKLATSGAAGGL